MHKSLQDFAYGFFSMQRLIPFIARSRKACKACKLRTVKTVPQCRCSDEATWQQPLFRSRGS